MTEEQTIKEAIELTTPLWTGYAYVRNATIQCRYELLTEMINLVNHKNEQIQALISGRESLQKLMAEKDADIELLKEHIDDYATAGRSIALNLSEFCNRGIPYTIMLAEASAKAAAEIEQKDIEIDILIRKKESLRDEMCELQAENEKLKADNEILSNQLHYIARELEEVKTATF